jgi:hypothetical protein
MLGESPYVAQWMHAGSATLTPATKESLMSRTDARRTTDAATPGYPSRHPIPQTPAEDNTSVPDNIVIEGTLMQDLYPPRPLAPVGVDRTRNAGRHWYSDPSMYLG